MIISKNFNAYTLLDAGDKEKLESWNGIILRRPDPMAIWPKSHPEKWHDAHAFYHRSDKGGGYWEFLKPFKEEWSVSFLDLNFKISPTNFKHTGLFPEQAANWEYITEKIKKAKREIKVLNLFAYTGAASVVASKAGASEVVHVDASKGMIEWAKENMQLSHLENHKIRFIVDDCLKFMKREIRRGHKYDIIIMDPPSYGRGPNKELFKFEDKINELLALSKELLSEKPLCLIVNSYTTGYSKTVLYNLMHAYFKDADADIICDELGIKIDDCIALPCGLVTRLDYHD